MMRLSELLGTKVVSRETAETLGEVRGVVVDPPSRRLVALQVGKGRHGRMVDWESLTGVGPAAVVVPSEEALRKSRKGVEERTVKGDVALLGGRVLTDRGDEAGTVSDVELDESTGALTTVMVGDQPVDAARLRAVGGYAVVIAGGDPG